MKADSHLQVDPSTVCVCQHANTEGEVQMGTAQADVFPRLDEEAWEQYYDAATIAGWNPFNCGSGPRAGDEKNVQ